MNKKYTPRYTKEMYEDIEKMYGIDKLTIEKMIQRKESFKPGLIIFVDENDNLIFKKDWKNYV